MPKVHEQDFVYPRFLSEACKKLGVKIVAEKLGISQSLISKNLSDELTRKNNELACKFLVEEGKSVPHDELWMVKIEPRHKEMVKTFFAGAGIKYRSFVE